MTGKQLRALALSLPGTQELPHMERTSFRTGGRIYATMTADETEAMVYVEPRARLYALAEEQPESFMTLGGWSRLGALGVKLSGVDSEQLKELLIASWRKRAKKRDLAAHEGAKAIKAKKPLQK